MGLENVMVTRNGQLYCYSVGRFGTFTEANEYCAEVQKHTPFKDAWAVRRKMTTPETKPAPVEKQPAASPAPAKPAETKPAPEAKPKPEPKPEPKPLAPEDKGTHYRIQFCTASRLLKSGDPDLQGIRDIHYVKSGKYYIYSCGNYTTLAEARKRLDTITKTTGFKDAFIFGIKDGKRFKVD